MVPINPGDFIMATIANLTVKADGSFEGTLATLNVTAPIAIVSNGRKAKDSEPDYRIVSRKNGFELGAGWKRFSQNRSEEHTSELQSLMRISYAVFCLKKKNKKQYIQTKQYT